MVNKKEIKYEVYERMENGGSEWIHKHELLNLS